MATATRTLRNFVDGEYVDPARGRARADPQPGDRRADRHRPAVRRGRRRPRRGGRAPRFDGWAGATPGERSLALLRLADAIEAARRRAGRAGGDRRRQADRGRQGRRDPRRRRQPALLRRRRAHPGGQRRRRVHGRPHVDDPARADRRRRPDRAVELPADDGRLEDRPGAGGRQHGRAQAGGDDAADDAAARRAGGRAPAAGRAQRDRRRTATRPGRRSSRTRRSTWSR